MSIKEARQCDNANLVCNPTQANNNSGEAAALKDTLACSHQV